MTEHNPAMLKVTVSLPRDLVTFADAQAQERHASRSQVIAAALRQAQAADEERLAAEGYLFYAQEATEFAAASMIAITEVLKDAC
jgi:metal-responsive CopG/Arc/MetJ family transcriptional regulator